MRVLCCGTGSVGGVLADYQDDYDRLKIDVTDKFVLQVRADLWLPYANSKDGIEASIFLCGDDGYVIKEIDDLIVGQPHANKSILCIQKKFGRVRTKTCGIPIVFDSKDELFTVHKIRVIWRVKALKKLVISECKVSFAEPEQNGIYSVWFYDNPYPVTSLNTLLRYNNDVIEDIANLSVYDAFCLVERTDIARYAVIEKMAGDKSDFTFSHEIVSGIVGQYVIGNDVSYCYCFYKKALLTDTSIIS